MIWASVTENHMWQSWGYDAPPGPQLHHLGSPGSPTTEWEPGGKEALHSSRRPEHRRQPRCKVGVVDCQRRKQRAPGWGRSTLPGCGQERRPQGPATSSKQREKERKVKTGRDHCRSPSKRHPWTSEPAPCSRCSREVKSSCPGLGCWPGKRSQTRGGDWGFLLSSDLSETRLLGEGGSLLVVSVNLPLASLSWTGCSVHPELVNLPPPCPWQTRPPHNTQSLGPWNPPAFFPGHQPPRGYQTPRECGSSSLNTCRGSTTPHAKG